MNSTEKEIGIMKGMALMGASDKEISDAVKKDRSTISRHRKNGFSTPKKNKDGRPKEIGEETG